MVSNPSQPRHGFLPPDLKFVTAKRSPHHRSALFSVKARNDGVILKFCSPRNSTDAGTINPPFFASDVECPEKKKSAAEEGDKPKIISRFRHPNGCAIDDAAASATQNTAATGEPAEAAGSAEPTRSAAAADKDKRRTSSSSCIELSKEEIEEDLAAIVGVKKSKRIERKEQKTKPFTVSLSKEEMEDDFKAITGLKLRRRRKKRPRHVQKLLESLFPGLRLGSISQNSYKVRR